MKSVKKKSNPWLTMQGRFDEELWDGLQEKLDRMREENLTGIQNDE
ncbi:MAG: hypothetical protein ACTSRC_14485 [Candidatus Helarchaeota archaeon]